MDYRCSHCDQMACACGSEDYRCTACHNAECNCKQVKAKTYGWWNDVPELQIKPVKRKRDVGRGYPGSK